MFSPFLPQSFSQGMPSLSLSSLLLPALKDLTASAQLGKEGQVWARAIPELTTRAVVVAKVAIESKFFIVYGSGGLIFWPYPIISP